MARSTPRVADTVLIGRDDAASSIAVGSPAWYAWLEQATTFAFSCAQGSFTARKERRGQSGWYWKAYRKRDGTLRRAYLGKSADLTPERLTAIAGELAGRATGPPLESASVLGPAMAAVDGELPHLTGARLPEGTLTFCFTDIEGSTQLWEQHPQTMPAALARHDAILREAIQAHRGVVFKTVGDSIHAVFSAAPDALAAALACQRALHAEPWGPTGPLQVRIALHTGMAVARDGDYFGAPLNRVARILAAGHGRQILLSLATEQLVRDHLPPGATLRDLGIHQLKDLRHAEQIFQLVSADLPTDFPRLRTLDAPHAPAPVQPLQLLDTKLYVPPARAQLVPRPRLLARLDTGLAGKLTLLSAPAGFGKTTLLSAWRATAAGSAVPFAWVSLDAADSDPLRFWSYVIAALDMLQPDSGATTLALLQSPQPPPIEAVLTPLLNALSTLPTDAVLVLDDYHLIDAPPIHSALAFLLDHLPPRLHLILTTRADPPLPLTRLRARQQLTELRAADLRFTTDETAAFLTELMSLPLSAHDIAVLEARTEGWIAGLQFAALAMRDRSDLAGFIRAFTGSHRFVVDYLAEEVLARQPPHLQTFLTQTAMLDRMCGPLCDAVLGLEASDVRPGEASSLQVSSLKPHVAQAYSQLLLEELERANLFLVPLDDERHWYRYHHLFAEVLRERLTSGATSATVATLHRRASAWFERQELLPEAIDHALKAADFAQAARLIETVGVPLLANRAIQDALSTWLAALPDAVVRARPTLCITHAWLLFIGLDVPAALQRVQDAEQALQRNEPAADDQNIRGEIAATHALIAAFSPRTDLAQVIGWGQQSLASLGPNNLAFRCVAAGALGMAYMKQGDITQAERAFGESAASGRASGNVYFAMAGIMNQVAMQRVRGAVQLAIATCRQTFAWMVEHGAQASPSSGGYWYMSMADLLREVNDLEAALRYATEGVALCDQGLNPYLRLCSHLVLARVKQAQGELDSALDIVHQAVQLAQQHQAYPTWATVLLPAVEAQLHVAQGELSTALQWAQTTSWEAGGLQPVFASHDLLYANEHSRIARAQVLIAHGRTTADQALLHEAIAELDQQRQVAEAAGLLWLQTKVYVLQALAYSALGDTGQALRDIASALALATPEGYVRLFVDEGAPMAALLAQSAAIDPTGTPAQEPRRAQADPISVYVERLLSAFPERLEARDLRLADTLPASGLKPQVSTLIEPLSQRELEILRLIAEGHSNQAIADRLVVAVSTVKKHVNNLYGKLDVQSRTQALVRAHDLNLL